MEEQDPRQQTVTINSRVAEADKVDTSEHHLTRITNRSRYG